MPDLMSPDELNKRVHELLKSDTERSAQIEELRTLQAQVAQSAVAAQLEARNRAIDPQERAIEAYTVDLSEPESKSLYADCMRDVIVGADGLAVQLRATRTAEGYAPGLLDGPVETPWSARLKDLLTDRNIRRMYQQSAGNRPNTPRLDTLLKRHLKRAPDELRSVFTPDTVDRIFANVQNGGAEAIFDFDVPRLVERIDMQPGLSSLFERVQMPANKVRFPVETRGLQMYIKSKATTDDPPRYKKSSAAYTSREYESVALALAMQADEDSMEDAFTGWTDVIMGQIARAVEYTREDLIVNGSKTAVHEDAIASWNPRGLWNADQIGGASDHRRAWDGLRRLSYASSSAVDRNAAADAAAVMRANRAALKGPLGLDDCVHIVSYNYFLTELLGLDDFKTLDAYGQLATRITGNISGPLPNQVGTIDGVPVVVSWLLTDDLAATGLYTGSGAKTGVITVSRARFWMMTRREVRIDSAMDITRGGYDYVATVRELFARAPSTSATDASVAFAYNL